MTQAHKKLSVALIGAGRMGACTEEKTRKVLHSGWFPLCHAEAIQSDPDLEFVAICDANEDLRNWATKRYNVPGSYSDYREMLSKEKPDLLAVATRTPGRCEIIEFAAQNGVRGMHIEKPLGNSVEEVRRSMAAVKANDVRLTYGARRRHMDAYRKAKQIIVDGVIGELAEVRVSFGRTFLMWNHPHSVDLILYYADSANIRSIQGVCRISEGSVHGLTIDDDPVLEWGVLQLANGVNGLISSAPGFTVDLTGERGILSVVADGLSLELRQMAPSGYLSPPTSVDVSLDISGTQNAFRELVKSLRGEAAETMRADELIESQLALFGLAQSSLLGGVRVDSSMLDEKFTITGRLGDKYS